MLYGTFLGIRVPVTHELKLILQKKRAQLGVPQPVMRRSRYAPVAITAEVGHEYAPRLHFN